MHDGHWQHFTPETAGKTLRQSGNHVCSLKNTLLEGSLLPTDPAFLLATLRVVILTIEKIHQCTKNNESL